MEARTLLAQSGCVKGEGGLHRNGSGNSQRDIGFDFRVETVLWA